MRTLNELLTLCDMGVISVKEIHEWIITLPKPMQIDGKETPSSLNDLTFGKLIELWGLEDNNDIVFIPCRSLLGLNDEMILKQPDYHVLGFSNWVMNELKKISELFASTSIEPTKEEIQAGVNDLNFGMFGMIDHYATRMGIADHEEVERVPWVRVYKCLEIDAKRALYQRRLQKILADK